MDYFKILVGHTGKMDTLKKNKVRSLQNTTYSDGLEMKIKRQKYKLHRRKFQRISFNLKSRERLLNKNFKCKNQKVKQME